GRNGPGLRVAEVLDLLEAEHRLAKPDEAFVDRLAGLLLPGAARLDAVQYRRDGPLQVAAKDVLDRNGVDDDLAAVAARRALPGGTAGDERGAGKQPVE